MILSLSFQQEVLILLFIMVISNLIEFFLMKDYGLRAKMLAILFIDHIYVIIAWAFNINYTFFYIYFLRIHKILTITADLTLNILFMFTEVSFFIIPLLFPELKEIEDEVFQRNRDNRYGSYPNKRPQTS